jgi:hypothetical protein
VGKPALLLGKHVPNPGLEVTASLSLVIMFVLLQQPLAACMQSCDGEQGLDMSAAQLNTSACHGNMIMVT